MLSKVVLMKVVLMKVLLVQKLISNLCGIPCGCGRIFEPLKNKLNFTTGKSFPIEQSKKCILNQEKWASHIRSDFEHKCMPGENLSLHTSIV